MWIVSKSPLGSFTLRGIRSRMRSGSPSNRSRGSTMCESPELAQSFSVLTAGRYLRDRLAGTGSLGPMAYTVDFKDVSTVGLESSPVADALAGLRANEAR